MACDIGILWSILNIIGGLAITLRDLDFDNIDFLWLCQLMRLFIGISIIWIGITSQLCDRLMMTWFPYWHTSFFFMGCTFIFFCCSPWEIEYVDDYEEDGWRQFQIIIEFITFCTGLLYLLLGILEFFGCVSCNKPTHLVSCCAGAGGGGGGGKSNKKKSSGSGAKRKKSSGNKASKNSKSAGLKTKKKKGGGTTRPMGSSAVFDK